MIGIRRRCSLSPFFFFPLSLFPVSDRRKGKEEKRESRVGSISSPSSGPLVTTADNKETYLRKREDEKSCGKAQRTFFPFLVRQIVFSFRSPFSLCAIVGNEGQHALSFPLPLPTTRLQRGEEKKRERRHRGVIFVTRNIDLEWDLPKSRSVTQSILE